MPLLALPDELLTLILRHAAPHDVGPWRWHARQQTLRACCLVSRRFHTITRPLLWELVRVRPCSVRQTILDEAGNGFARYTKALGLQAPVKGEGKDWARGKDPEVLPALLACFPNVVELQLHSYTASHSFRLGTIGLIKPGLQRLAIVNCILGHPFPPAFPHNPLISSITCGIPCLVELGLIACTASHSLAFAELRKCSGLPALRALRLLPMVTAQSTNMPASLSTSSSSSTRVPSSLDPRAKHLAVVYHEYDVETGVTGFPAATDLEPLLALLETHKLQSLWLPSQVAPGRKLDTATAGARDGVVDLCAQRGTHVGWMRVEIEGAAVDDTLAVPEFWEYFKGIKANVEETQ
ncbi:hypothetical protein JCM10449v2_008150 [Rhodotorula kratochvilovae]